MHDHPEPIEVEKILARSRELLATHQDREAYNLLKQLIESVGSHPDVVAALGDFYSREENWYESVRLYERATKIAPQSAHLWKRFGDELMHVVRFAEAASAYENAIALIKADENEDKGIGAFRVGVPQDAEVPEIDFTSFVNSDRIRALVLALRLDSTTVTHWLSLASALHELRDYHACLEAINKAALLAPANTAVWLLKGMALNELGRYSEAELSLAQAGMSPESLVEIGRALIGQQRYAEAIHVLTQLITRCPHYGLAWLYLAQAFRVVGNVQDAVAAERRAQMYDLNDTDEPF